MRRRTFWLTPDYTRRWLVGLAGVLGTAGWPLTPEYMAFTSISVQVAANAPNICTVWPEQKLEIHRG